jgi:RHS repeat-associated protein
MYIDGQGYVDVVDLNNKTLYASPYLVYNEQGYSKHYYAGAERVSSRIGGGMQDALVDPLNSALPHLSYHDNYAGIASDLNGMLIRSAECSGMFLEYLTMDPILGIIYESTGWSNPEPNWYIYHSDHLGSSAFLTDASGTPTQHLQYMPFGETFVEQRSITSYYTPYTFSAKERDPETGYSYFGARYYSSDISVWLSVDPMGDERSWLSPYNYCQWKPVTRVDITGRLDDEWELDLETNTMRRTSFKGGDSHQYLTLKGSTLPQMEYEMSRDEMESRHNGEIDHFSFLLKDDFFQSPNDIMANASNNSSSEFAGVLSLANGCVGLGLGVMCDVGVVSDMRGDASGYLTLGLFLGYGQAVGFGFSGNNLSSVDDFFGFSSGALVPVPYFKNLGLEGYFDVERGAVRDYYGTNYAGFGLNASVGKAAGVYISYTLRLYPVDNATYFTRPCRR